MHGIESLMAWTVDYRNPLPLLGEGCVVAIGNFDGVHAGHLSLLTVAKAEAQKRRLPLVVLTFEPHPRTVLFPEQTLKRLTERDVKVELLGRAGVDGVAVLGFTKDVAAWAPQQFMDDVLAGWLDAEVVCVGEDFKFGHKAAGTVASLREAGIDVLVVDLHADEHGVVSSTRLRGA